MLWKNHRCPECGSSLEMLGRINYYPFLQCPNERRCTNTLEYDLDGKLLENGPKPAKDFIHE